LADIAAHQDLRFVSLDTGTNGLVDFGVAAIRAAHLTGRDAPDSGQDLSLEFVLSLAEPFLFLPDGSEFALSLGQSE